MVVLFMGNYNYLPKIKQTLHMTCLTAKCLCMYKKFYIHYVFSIKTDTIFPKRSSSNTCTHCCMQKNIIQNVLKYTIWEGEGPKD